jgi:hypothetical protein
MIAQTEKVVKGKGIRASKAAEDVLARSAKKLSKPLTNHPGCGKLIERTVFSVRPVLSPGIPELSRREEGKVYPDHGLQGSH